MSSSFRQIFAVLAMLLYAISMPAQDIPVLPEDSAVLKGVMPNGMSYYLVSNKSVAGAADFALVQKVGTKTVPDSLCDSSYDVIDISREAISFLPRLKSSFPQDFMIRHGVAPREDGYVKVTDDATVFRMENVSLADGKAVLDSTLLMIMDVADRATWAGNKFMSMWYTPADQAVVVAGDIDAKSVAEKLRYMSYMTPYHEPVPRQDYGSNVREDAVFETDSAQTPFVNVSLTWVSSRAPREYMNTVQPAIFEMTVTTLGEIAVERVRRSLMDRELPVADVSYGHVCSAASPYDDSFTLNVTVRRQDAEAALEAATEVMASLDSSGAGMDEYLLAEALFLDDMTDEAADKTNGAYIERCINAFLYNSSLASPKERLGFHRSRNIPESMRLKLFNDVAMALLDSSANLTVRGAGDTAALRNSFDSVWRRASEGSLHPSVMNMSDTIGFPGKQAKVKIKSVKKEHVSGGSIWIFSNGFKVIYKKMPADRMYYTLALSRGYSSISGLEPGEGAFMSDYFRTSHIAGLKGDIFMNMLKREGITMDVNVSMSNTMVGGHLPEERMQLLLRSLLAVTNQRTRDDRTFNYYKESEDLALEVAEGGPMARMTAIDSIMCPDYRYSPYKAAGNITGGFQERAEAFFDEVFSKTGDGVLVLVGNMDEEKLKKVLLEYVGGFRVSESAYRRPVVRYQPVSGWSTYTIEGDRNCIDIALSARMPISAENYIAAHLAADILKRRLTEELGESGMYLTLSHNCRIYPEERFNLLISASEASSDGFMKGIVPDDPIVALGKIRNVLLNLHDMEISEDMLKICKDRLKNDISMEMNDPRYWVDAIVLRYLDGKDLSTDYARRVEAVTPVKVQTILNMLDDGCKVEYVTSKEN